MTGNGTRTKPLRAVADFAIARKRPNATHGRLHPTMGISQGNLVAALDVERPWIVPVFNTLERRGLAVRQRDTQDEPRRGYT